LPLRGLDPTDGNVTLVTLQRAAELKRVFSTSIARLAAVPDAKDNDFILRR
jgi:hypothetical protein